MQQYVKTQNEFISSKLNENMKKVASEEGVYKSEFLDRKNQVFLDLIATNQTYNKKPYVRNEFVLVPFEFTIKLHSIQPKKVETVYFLTEEDAEGLNELAESIRLAIENKKSMLDTAILLKAYHREEDPISIRPHSFF